MSKSTENFYIGKTLRIISNLLQFKRLQERCRGYSDLRMKHLPGSSVTIKHIDKTYILVQKENYEFYLHPESFESDCLNITDDDPIFDAILKNDQNEILKLLDENNLNALNKSGKTPLHYACSLGKLDIVKLLSEYKPNLNIFDNEVKNLIDTCAMNHYREIIHFLIETFTIINSNSVTEIESIITTLDIPQTYSLTEDMPKTLTLREDLSKDSETILSNNNNQLICQICRNSVIQFALNCGHVVCKCCLQKLILCPFCRNPITSKIQIYLN